MGTQPELQAVLKGITPNVYFQPPENVKISYPCIVYKRDSAHTEFAGNKPYSFDQRYQVTVIDQDPTSEIPKAVAALPKCLYDRFYTANQLNHDVYTLYF